MNKELVKRGVDLLDNYDRDWYWSVDTDTLDISSVEDCVLGQCFRNEANVEETSYEAGKRILGIDSGKMYGFVGQTTPAWIKEIEARKEDAIVKSLQELELVIA